MKTKQIELLKVQSKPVIVNETRVMDLTALFLAPERYINYTFVPRKATHSIVCNLFIYTKNADEPTMTIRYGLLPYVESWILLDKNWLRGDTLFPDAPRGNLKVVCHGSRVQPERITSVQLVMTSGGASFRGEIQQVQLNHEKPTQPPLPQAKLTDKFGQNTQKSWPEKVTSVEELQTSLVLSEELVSWPEKSWSKYGGDESQKLAKGTGFFTKLKKEGRWYLVDPEGNAFFSIGPDCVNVSSDCKVSGIEDWCEWLPVKDEPGFGEFYTTGHTPEGTPIEAYSFMKANLYRVYGEKWQEKWQTLILQQLQQMGMNTIGNWSDPALFRKKQVPYVTSLPNFPDTKQMIFRDFPDVFSPEYTENAKLAAQALAEAKDDPWMIGYFLRNEPAWAFVDHLVIADEVLFNSAMTASKAELLRRLEEQYHHDISALNTAWQTEFQDFSELQNPQRDLSHKTPQAADDLKAFSVEMVRRYVSIPAEACRQVDPHHLILGMRWAWISDADLIAGWENFDVFSINCYAIDPTSQLQQVVNLGVDLPVMIGEFHFGALDSGLTATGLEGVLNQAERGLAYRQYVEQVAAHPNGVGCHYFQCYDQFHLGRFDGENYNIGIFDVCGKPYEEMKRAVLATSRELYLVNAGEKAPYTATIATIPMIAY